jgi:hypothetical protein
VPPVAAKACEYEVPTWPLASDAVVIVRAAGAIVRLRLTFVVCGGELESVTLNMSAVAFAAAVGVPLIRPVDAFNARPLGSVPEVSDHVYGVVPPVAASVCEYGAPTWPLASDAVVIVKVAGAIVRLRLTFVVCAGEPASVTLNASAVALAAAVGVPPITPVEEFSVKPPGNVPEVNDQV